MTDWAQWLMDKLPPVAAPEGDADAQVREALSRHLALDAIATNLSAPLPQPLFGAFLNPEARRGLRESIGPELDQRRAALAATVATLLELPAGATSLWPLLRDAAGTSNRAFVERLVGFSAQLPVSLWLELVRENEALREALAAQPPRSTETRAALEAELSSSDRGLVSAVVRALGYLGEIQAVPVLRDKLKTEADAALREVLITAIIRCTGLVSEFDDAPSADRAAAVAGLTTASAAAAHLGDSAPEVDAAARRVLSGLQPEPVAKALAGALETGKSTAQLRAVLELLEPHVASLPALLITPLMKHLGHRQLGGLADALLAKVVAAHRPESEHRRLLRKHVVAGSLTAAALEQRAAPLRPPALPAQEPGDEAGSAAWQDFASTLSAAGDVRGNAIARALAGQKPQTFLTKHPELLGTLPELLDKYLTQLRKGFEYRHGLISAARARVPTALAEAVELEDVVEALLGAPATCFLRELSVGRRHLHDGSGYVAVSELLAGAQHARGLTSVFLGDFGGDDFDENEYDYAPEGWPELGDISRLWSALPRLETVRLRGGGGKLGDISAPRLRKLVLESLGINRDVFAQVVAMTAPELEHLELWLGALYEAPKAADLEKLLARDWPRLTSLGLRNAGLTRELIALLARSKLLAKLETLDLSLGALSDDDAPVLVQHAAAFSHLKTLSFDENQLDESVAQLRKAFPQATFEEQREIEDDPQPAVESLSSLARRW